MTLSKCAKLGLQVQTVVARVNFPHEGTRGLSRTLGEQSLMHAKYMHDLCSLLMYIPTYCNIIRCYNHIL
jgi:hypothetical protein